MHQAARPLPISPKMFRHFAVITIVATAAVAMFADGENRELVTERIEQRVVRNDLLKAESDQVGSRRMAKSGLRLRNSNQTYLPFAPDEPVRNTTYGSPMDGSETWSGPSPGARNNAVKLRDPRTRRDMAQSSALPIGQSAPDAEQLANLRAASLARSGIGASED